MIQMLRSSFLGFSFALGLSCSASAPVGLHRPPPVAPARSPASVAASAPAAPDPRVTPAEAHVRVLEAFAKAGLKLTRSSPGPEEVAKLLEAGLNEDLLQGAIEHEFEACLAAPEPKDDVCGPAGPRKTDGLLDLLEQIARPSDDPRPGAVPGFTRTLSLLSRLHARGVSSAGLTVTRIFERRHLARAFSCAPPTQDEVAAAVRRIGDMKVPGDGGPRSITAEERGDLAYALAALAQSDPAVGTFEDDYTSPPLPKDDPARGELERLRAKLRRASLDGDATGYLEAARAYLGILGYPGPLRMKAEDDARWGGSGVSYMMRTAAEYAEAVGDFPFAHELYLRANPGGGMCGTSVDYHREIQTQGAIRTAPSCKSTVAALLFQTSAYHEAYRADRLAKAGFDLERLYRGALVTIDQPGSWADRVRAVEGYADTAQGRGVKRLLELARAASPASRVRAIDALGLVAETLGDDPCAEGTAERSRYMSRSRQIRGANWTCETRLSPSLMDEIARTLRGSLRDRDPGVRVAASTAAGRIADTRSKAILTALASSDPFKDGSERCTDYGTPKQRCTPIFPVRDAAREALEAIAEAEKIRREARARALRP